MPEPLVCSWIATESDTVYFNMGVNLNYDEVLVISQNDLQEPFNINKNGDSVSICIHDF